MGSPKAGPKYEELGAQISIDIDQVGSYEVTELQTNALAIFFVCIL